MRFYVSTAWTNRQQARDIMGVLKKAGHEPTRDWTHDEIYPGWELDIVEKDVRGVLDCDLFIMVLRGGRGAHTELGMAIASGKKIVICMDNESDMNEGGYGCPFYWREGITRIVGGYHDWLRQILKLAFDMDKA